MNNDVENLQTVETEIEESQNDKEKVLSEDSVICPSGTDCSESSTEDSISNNDSESSITEKLRETIAYQQNVIEQNSVKYKSLERDYSELKQTFKDLEMKLDLAVKKKNAAIKEKEAVVVRYAVSEKNVLKEKQQKEIAEKKLCDALRETDILQHKVQTMVSEKSRICQLLDNKIYDNKILQQELEQKKSDFAILESKLKWAQTNLKTELDIHKETQAKLENMTSKYQEAVGIIDQVKREAEEQVKTYRNSEENRAHLLDRQVQEQQASLILLKHEKKDKEEQISILQKQLEKLQTKQKEMLQENNHLSLKVQQLEKDRSENELKLSELRGCADQQRQDVVDLQTKSVQLEQLKLQLKQEQEQLAASNEQMSLLKQRNQELEGDMETCRAREAELLLFTQQLTDKNVRLQSEFTSLETRVQQLSCEQTLLKRQFKEQETKAAMCSAKLIEEKRNYKELVEKLTEKSKICEQLKQEAVDQKSENILIKRKYDMSLREVNRELQHYHKKLEKFEDLEKTSNSSSNSSLNDNHTIDQQTLIEHIVKLQKISAKKSEKIDFLEEHVNNLVIELQKKSKLLQSYVMREQKSSNKRDSIKVK
ncbi:coiled-coil domain-containing protein 186-like [Diorhabda sublineata]|uniref:coiled-coil domain-containing protein 186-like n=1 Tax=Diorhabda sublineata TaxID=1163346 RepID=UPI0024E0DF8D|nr:coiled-coil domain-containing protein 186-like [Diorhabda sublineata]